MDRAGAIDSLGSDIHARLATGSLFRHCTGSGPLAIGLWVLLPNLNGPQWRRWSGKGPDQGGGSEVVPRSRRYGTASVQSRCIRSIKRGRMCDVGHISSMRSRKLAVTIDLDAFCHFLYDRVAGRAPPA